MRRSKASKFSISIFLCVFISSILTQSSDIVSEGDFCKVDSDCDPPKYICSRSSDDSEDEIKVCIRKPVFPLYREFLNTLLPQFSELTSSCRNAGNSDNRTSFGHRVHFGHLRRGNHCPLFAALLPLRSQRSHGVFELYCNVFIGFKNFLQSESKRPQEAFQDHHR